MTANEEKVFQFDKSRVRILVVDDEQSIRDMIALTLKEEGWAVDSAENGRVALEKILKTPFHIVMSDIQMPEMTGIELLEAIRAKLPLVEVVIMTSNATLDTAVKALKNGAYDYLNKPFEDLSVIPKKMTQVAEKILLRQQNAELFKRLKKATINLRLLYDATRELNGILDVKALRECVLKELPVLMQSPQVKGLWLERTETGWIPVAEIPGPGTFPAQIEGSDLEAFIASTGIPHLKAVRLEHEGAIREAIIYENLSEVLPEFFFQEVRTTYDKVMMHARWVSLANKDGLTMIHNHRYFQDRLRQEFSQAKRQNSPLSLILMDVDHFKKYNDQNGHPAGDELLKTLARLLDKELGNRESDILARYGGEEFVLMLPFTPLEGAMIKAKRILEAVNTFPFANRESQPLGCVSLSIGVASFPQHAEQASELVEKADQALYAAKKSGRNRIFSFDEIATQEIVQSVEASAASVESLPVTREVEALNEARTPSAPTIAKPKLAEVIDWGDDLPDPNKLAEQMLQSQSSSVPESSSSESPTPEGETLVELEPLRETKTDDGVNLDDLMSSIDTAFAKATQNGGSGEGTNNAAS